MLLMSFAELMINRSGNRVVVTICVIGPAGLLAEIKSSVLLEGICSNLCVLIEACTMR